MTVPILKPLTAALTVSALALVAGCGSGTSNSTSGGNITQFASTRTSTGTASGDLDSVTWYGDYRPLYSLDPLTLADYPEETVIPNICEPMLKVSTDYAVSPGAVSYTWSDPTHLLLTLTTGVTFSDGSAVTPDDVAYSISRNLDPSVASNYGYGFANVASVKPSGASTVTVTLKQPDRLVVDSLATLAGAIVKKSFVEKSGAAFGSPTTGVMCTGPFALKSYDGTSKLVMVRNDHYWDTAHAARTKTFTFEFPADPSALANGLTSGRIDGALNVPTTLVKTLKSASNGKLWIGGSGSTPVNVDILMTKSTGTLADTAVRRALSTALDRKAIAAKIYDGAADPLYRVSGPGLWGYATAAFKADYGKLVSAADTKAATEMVTKAGASGKAATFAYPSGDSQSEQLATVLQQTATTIGLKLKITALPAQQYGTLFTDPKARSSYDAILTKNYVELPDPLLMDRLYGGTGGATNFSDYSNPAVDDSLAKASQLADPDAKAEAVLAAEHELDRDLPSIPVVGQRAVVFQNARVTGAPLTFSFMSSAWAAAIGAK